MCSCKSLSICAECLSIEEWFHDVDAMCKNTTEVIHIGFIGIDELLDPKPKDDNIEDMDQPKGAFTDRSRISKQGTISNKNELYHTIIRDYYLRTKLHKTR